ncbi:MAG: AsnC family transcriptional regulator [Comamonadaceae bacterium]|nr:MAG: AsnC family transcriptional regulator [Comamonadaceae bacterium]
MTAAVPMPDALDVVLALVRAHASLMLRWRQDLAAFHGLDFGDFQLLHALACEVDGVLPMETLAPALGLSPSEVLRRLIPLEKTGWARRLSGPAPAGLRSVQLHPSGRRLVESAIATVEDHGEAALLGMDPAQRSAMHAALLSIAQA